MKTLHVLIASLILVLGFGLTACQRSDKDKVEAAREPDRLDKPNAVLTADEKEFTDYAAEMHTGEIKMAELAKEKSQDRDVTNYADAVIARHTDALILLSAHANQNRTLQNTKASLDTERHSEYLSSLPAGRFEHEFLALMIADHKDAADTFSRELSSTQNQELKDYLNEVSPDLERSMNEAQRIQKLMTSTKNH